MKNKKRIAIIFNDVHLKQGNEKEILEAFIDMIDFAVDTKINNIFLAGDLFDSRSMQRQSTLFTFDKCLSYADSFSINIFAIAGNHDKTIYESKDSFLYPFRYHPSFHYMDDIVDVEMEDFGKKFTFLPFFTDDLLIKKIKESDGGDCLISHFEMVGSTNLGKVNKKSNITPSMLSKWDKVFLGHYHNYHKVSENIAHLPAFVQSNFGEDTNKGFTVLYEDLSYEIIQSKSKKYIRVDVDLDKMVQKDIDNLVEEYKDSTNSIQFRFKGNKAQIKALNKEQFNNTSISINCDFNEEIPIENKSESIKVYTKENIKDTFKEYCISKKLNYKKWLPYIDSFLKYK